MKIYTEVIWKMEESGKITETSSKSEDYNGPVALFKDATLRPSTGEWGWAGAAAGSQARKGRDLGFQGAASFNKALDKRDPMKSQTRDLLTDVDARLAENDPDYLYLGERADTLAAEGPYTAAQAAYDQAVTDMGTAEEDYGSFDEENWEDISDEDKGRYFEEAGENLEQNRLQKEMNIGDIEQKRGQIIGEGVAQAGQAEQARLGSGLQYGGPMEEQIKLGTLGLEGEAGSTQTDELGVMSKWESDLGDYENDLIEIERQWTQAKTNWDNAWEAMYGPAGAEVIYESEMDIIASDTKASFYTDYEAEGGLTDVKEEFQKVWDWPQSGKSGAEGIWRTEGGAGSGDFVWTGGELIDGSGKSTVDYGKGYGGHSDYWDRLVSQYLEHADRLGSDYYEGDDNG
tara:strand:- start:11240 stop:12442 length:1203 start_codon:yes stop_codon:yes gene_type:complete